ncbi:hypothetical protein [Nocardioides bizhenqiangii]|uniref:DUF2029 domain-containing protein n=1 Tax=Nocardioides bizhenqiangii TaxID=3095076 RepID=A0ABZ0ZR50_9ACTN|nr:MULTISPECIES: hypothetical protein [unclassified Nocardioides]MDZ5619594.1 hypothetical protein [Nocardioides sp. HM23]WQQ26391.1 hypothetical protein SHK19_20850 [Nocardioides sp. HM61]
MIAAIRAWGGVRVVLVVGLTVLLIETTATDQLSVPPFSFALDGWTFVPPLVAVVCADPLVDRTPQLTEHATRAPAFIAVARLALAGSGAAAVSGYCLLSPDGVVVAQYVVAAVSVAAVAVALADSWYWLPLLPLAFGWIQHTHGQFPTQTVAIPVPTLGAIVAGSCLAYVGGTLVRSGLSRARPAGRPPAPRRPRRP